MVSWAHDESKTHDAGKYQINIWLLNWLMPEFRSAAEIRILMNWERIKQD